MTATWMHVGTAACFTGCGALALAALRYGRRATALEGAPAARLHVSDVAPVPVSPGTGVLEAAEPYGAFVAGQADAAEFHYCPAEFRVTAHAVHADGTRHCWHCGPTQGET
ncbi:hypothetical protein [Streptomyces mirabilis]|uniref:hypothetical protein n=1 Tax=Streptomyces mirabilis TaxID=68239 RepID=UPI002251DF16|nr:hypothetical protein [Streptomyces mirabilis]MCX4609497.1 hypothetical protein [Streptomyces mirabilis]